MDSSQHKCENKAIGEPLSTENTILTTGASMVQDFSPLKNVCAHLNAFHVYASDPKRAIETNHYCAHVNNNVRQCLLYDSADANARLIGIEYMVTQDIYEQLPAEERKLWHSHGFEVTSGMLVMPQPGTVPLPTAAWEAAEKREMSQVVGLYGKVYHLWQTDRGDAVPLGAPELMTSFTAHEQMQPFGGIEGLLAQRDARVGVDWRAKREARRDIEVPEIHQDADQTWKKSTTS